MLIFSFINASYFGLSKLQQNKLKRNIIWFGSIWFGSFLCLSDWSIFLDNRIQLVYQNFDPNCPNRMNAHPYQIQKDEIEKLIQEILEADIIRHSVSPFSNLILLVKKKDGCWRFYVDYRTLNKETILNKFPIFVIDELLRWVIWNNNFFQNRSKVRIPLDKNEITYIHKTTFRTHEGYYKFLVMPFILTNAPTTF